MKCPKCQSGTLQPYGHFRWRCSGSEESNPCGFACGLAFFFDDENLNIKLEVGMPVSKLKLSARARELMQSNVIKMDEFHESLEVAKLESVKQAETEERDLSEISNMMKEVVGRSAEVHRVLTSGESYHKFRNGGLIGKNVGRMEN